MGRPLAPGRLTSACPTTGPAYTRPAITKACRAVKSYLKPYVAGYGQPFTFPSLAAEGAAGASLLKQGLAIGGTAVGTDMGLGDVQDDMATYEQLLQQASQDGGTQPMGSRWGRRSEFSSE
jgi:hypothetical protein